MTGTVPDFGPHPAPASALRRALEALLGVPFTTGNEVRVLRNGAETFPVVCDAIAGASRSIDLLWFAWGRGAIADEVTSALADRARAGVRVRVLLDGFGALHIPDRQVRELKRAGCTVEFYRLCTWRLTSANERTHRRVLVCDEHVAVTGGVGFEPPWNGDADGAGSA